MANNWKIAKSGLNWLGFTPSGSIKKTNLNSLSQDQECSGSESRAKQYSAAYYTGVAMLVLLVVLLQVLLIKITWNYAVPQIAPSARQMNFLTALVLKLMIDLFLM